MYSWKLPCFVFSPSFICYPRERICLSFWNGPFIKGWGLTYGSIALFFSKRGKNFAKLRCVCQVHKFCGGVESGTRQMHCVNFEIQGEIQTVSFLCHLEHDRREPGALLLLWRASAFRNLHSLDYKLLNYTGSCPLKCVCIRKLKLAHTEWRRPVSKPLAMSYRWFCLLKKDVSPCWKSKSLPWLSWTCCPRETTQRRPISSAPSRGSIPLPPLLPLALSDFSGSDGERAGQRIKSNRDLEVLLNTGVRAIWCPKSWTVIGESGEAEAVKEGR